MGQLFRAVAEGMQGRDSLNYNSGGVGQYENMAERSGLISTDCWWRWEVEYEGEDSGGGLSGRREKNFIQKHT